MKCVKKRLGLTATLVLYVFVIMVSAMLLSWLFMAILDVAGLMDFSGMRRPPEQIGVFHPFRGFMGLVVFSSVFGVALSAFLSTRTLKPIRKLIDATGEIAKGNFGARVEPQGIRELEQLSISFNKMAWELSSIETLRSDFVNNFSHEFKTPIVSIRGFAKLLHEGNLSEAEQREYLEIIIAESERLASLSTSILNLSKYEAIEIVSSKAPYRLDEQIRQAVVILEPKWSAKNIEIDIALDQVTFSGDENLLQQIWLNLLGNAVKFTPMGGTITIGLSEQGSAVKFTIRDTGIGMDDATKAHIFEKFYQGDKSRSPSGNGLGLPIVQRIVELCGGTIEVTSQPGKGSVFTVILPKH